MAGLHANLVALVYGLAIFAAMLGWGSRLARAFAIPAGKSIGESKPPGEPH